MTILEMIAEWRKGCSVAGPMVGDESPCLCVECTEALINAIEKKCLEEEK